MAVFGSRRGYFSRYGRRGGGRYGYRGSSLKRRARGNMRAATQQRDSTEVVINRVMPLSVQFPPGTDVGGSTVNIWQELRNSDFYGNYAPMYDQVKLCGVRAKLNGSVQATNTSSYLTPTVVTAWDRNGLSGLSAASNISTYSSAISKPWSLGNAFTQTRSIYASTMSEKSQYVSPQSLNLAVSDPNNPANPAQIQSIPFKPQLLVQINLPTSSALQGQTLVFNVELDIICKFRGLRKGVDIPTPGEVGSINFPVTITGVQVAGGGSSTQIPFTSFTYTATTGSVTQPVGSTLMYITVSSSRIFHLRLANAAVQTTIPAGSWYYLVPSTPDDTVVYFLTSYNQLLPGVRDTVVSDQIFSLFILPEGGSYSFQLPAPPSTS